jgi:hypothetical protein
MMIIPKESICELHALVFVVSFQLVIIFPSGAVGITNAKLESVTVGICIAVILNCDVRQVWTPFGTIMDCIALPFDIQHKPPPRDVVRILQSENETLQIRIRLALQTEFPHHQRKTAENVPFCVFNESQSVCVAIAAYVSVAHSETVAAVSRGTWRRPPERPKQCMNRSLE